MRIGNFLNRPTRCINALVLSIIGFVYKIAGSSKILGHFEPADARYFFSTFTYKNHWGAFCILALGGIGALTQHYKADSNIRNLVQDLLVSL